MKYIIFEDGEGIETPILFSPQVNHKSVAEAMHLQIGLVATSAGMVNLGNGKMKCHGKSTTLNMTPGIDDELIIESYLKEDKKLRGDF
jgi:hypothetical protein